MNTNANNQNYKNNMIKQIIQIQKMSYNGQQRHELKIADARILMVIT
jgi:hypothetical protein